MSKIVLRRIKLINWYGFINEEIPLSEDLTLITGENESGKSTILDAIKYAYTGDTKFNEAKQIQYGNRQAKLGFVHTVPSRSKCEHICETSRRGSNGVHTYCAGIF